MVGFVIYLVLNMFEDISILTVLKKLWLLAGSYWLRCNIKLTLIECKILMGIQKYKTIFAQVSNANLCLNLEVGQEVQFSGLVYDFGEDASTHIYIQTLTKL